MPPGWVKDSLLARGSGDQRSAGASVSQDAPKTRSEGERMAGPRGQRLFRLKSVVPDRTGTASKFRYDPRPAQDWEASDRRYVQILLQKSVERSSEQ